MARELIFNENSASNNEANNALSKQLSVGSRNIKGIYSTTDSGRNDRRTEMLKPAHNEYRSHPHNEISDMNIKQQNKTSDGAKSINR